MSLELSANNHDFQKLSSKDWWEKIDKDLKGKPREKLSRIPVEGIKTKPFYHFDQDMAKHNAYQYQKRDENFLAHESWLLGQKFFIKKGNEKEILEFIKESILGDTHFIELNFTSDFNSRIIADALHSFEGKLVLSSDNLKNLEKASEEFRNVKKLSLILDPNISEAILKNKLDDNYLKLIFQSALIPINSDYLIDKGANEIQEGIYILACLNKMLELNHEKKAPTKFLLRLNTGSNLFLQIAKFRSLRNLSDFILKKWAVDSEILLEAQSSTWNKSVYDRFTNILRLSSESFASIVGGVDILNISGFEESLGIENEFTHRNARNISHLLKHESHLDKVKDQAAGSYYVETLTEQYSKLVWEGFQEIERSGGILEYRKTHDIEDSLDKSKTTNQSLFGDAKIKMVGTNTFPNPLDELTEENIIDRKVDRLAYKFEELRSMVDLRSINNKGNRPQAVLLKLGKSEMRIARAGFSANFLECAGIKILEEDSISKVPSKAEIVVICASDEDYIQNGMNWVNEIKSQNSKSNIILAGNPENKEELEKAGIDFFIYLRAPLETTLSQILKSIGIE